MIARLGRAAALAGLLVVLNPVWPYPVRLNPVWPDHVRAADAPAADEGPALDIRRLSPEQRRRLVAGDTIAYRVLETSDTELGAGVAMYVPVPLGRAAEALTSPEVVLREPSITASGAVPAGATTGFTFLPGEISDAQDALDAAPGSRLNLALPEIEAFRAVKGRLRGADRAAVLEAAASQWRTLLVQRGQAFQARGLEGVAPYARRSGVSDPAALLRVAAADSRIVAHVAPRLADSLLRYPAEQSPTAISRFYWVKRLVQGRPTPILVHHLVDVSPAMALYVERHIYVGHTYNASQILSAAVPYEDGVLILSSNRVSTDQVAGFGGDMKRLIGRRQLQAEIVKRFDRIRAALAAPAPPTRVESP